MKRNVKKAPVLPKGIYGLALGLMVAVSACAAPIASTGFPRSRTSPLLSSLGRSTWEARYADELGRSTRHRSARRAQPDKPRRAKAVTANKPQATTTLTPGAVPTGLPDAIEPARSAGSRPKRSPTKKTATAQLAKASVARPAASGAGARPDGLQLASNETPDLPPAMLLSIRRREPLIKGARKLLGKRMEPAEFARALIETTDLSSKTAFGGDAGAIRDLFVRLQRMKRTFSEGRPNAGDLIFFHNSRDLNGDGKSNDWYTSLGIVVRVLKDGTIVFIAPGVHEISELRANLDRPRTRKNERRQTILNDYIRPKTLADKGSTQYLAGELFAGFAHID